MKRLVLAATIVLCFGCGEDGSAPRDADRDTGDNEQIDANIDSTGGPDGTTDDAVTGDRIEMDAPDATTPDGIDATDTTIPLPINHGGVSARQEGHEIVVTNDMIEIRYRLYDGTFDLAALNGPASIRNAESRVLLADPADEYSAGIPYGTMGRKALSWTAEPVDDETGSGLDISVSFGFVAPDPAFVVTLGLRGAHTYVLSKMSASWPDGAADSARIKRLSPIVVDYSTKGALFLGADPSKHVVLDNGADIYFDFQASVFRVGFRDSVFFQPGSASNWNMALVDPVTGKSIVAAYMTNERSIGLVRLHYAASRATEQNGIKGFTDFESIGHYDPPRATDDGSLESDLFYVDLNPATPFDGLENWAKLFAQYHHKGVWTDVPTGWNSWGGGGSSGGYSQDIDADRIMANYDAMVTDFKPYGMKYFLIDDGWQQDHGDWITRKDKFPDREGTDFMPWLAERATADGLRPGLWIAPFWVRKSSDLYSEHPDWFADLNDYGNLMVKPDNNAILDLTNPEVLTFIHDLFTRLTQDWGYKWIKMDYAYYALFTKNLHDPDVTASEAYRNALRVIRDAIGPDTFLTGISSIGLYMGIADACRTTLDNFPRWGDNQAQGFKVTVQTAAHRYYLSNVWVNHPDLIFFRPEPMGLTFNEARAFASFVAVSGGIVKLAEPYVDMHQHQEWLDTVRPMMPVYPRTARPLDLFEMAWPEVWVLPVEREGRAWHVAGLFNWGINENVAESAPVAEQPRQKTIRWRDMGMDDTETALVFNVWERTCDWSAGPNFAITAQPRTGTLLVVRPAPVEPAVVFTTRHIMGGAVEITEESVVDGGNGLTFNIANPAGTEVTVFVAADSEPATVSIATAVITAGPCENVWAVTFTSPDDVSAVEITF